MNSDAADRLATAGAMVAAMRRNLAADADTDLAPLLGAVEDACRAVTGLPAGDVQPLMPRVIALLADVEVLERALEATRKAAGEDLGGLARARRASAAYGRAPRRP